MKKLLLILTVATLTITSCSKDKEGCNDRRASNYDDKVVVDDGSCIFTAVTFYADSINLNGKGITNIDITVNGSVVGSFNGSYNSGNQICGETNTAVYNTNGESSVAWSAVIHQVDGVTVSSSGVFNGITSESCVIQQVLP